MLFRSPRFLLQEDLTQTAKLLYALLLDRATLSQSNGWLDEGGRIYLVFSIEKIAAALDRSPMIVKTALSELEDAGLIERRRSGFSLTIFTRAGSISPMMTLRFQAYPARQLFPTSLSTR